MKREDLIRGGFRKHFSLSQSCVMHVFFYILKIVFVACFFCKVHSLERDR